MNLDELRSLKKSYFWKLDYENHTKSHARLTEICDPHDYTQMDE